MPLHITEEQTVSILHHPWADSSWQDNTYSSLNIQASLPLGVSWDKGKLPFQSGTCWLDPILGWGDIIAQFTLMWIDEHQQMPRDHESPLRMHLVELIGWGCFQWMMKIDTKNKQRCRFFIWLIEFYYWEISISVDQPLVLDPKWLSAQVVYLK